MPGPRYHLVPNKGEQKPPPQLLTEPRPETAVDWNEANRPRRASGYGWAALAIATLLFAFTWPAMILVIWLMAAAKRWLLPRLD